MGMSAPSACWDMSAQEVSVQGDVCLGVSVQGDVCQGGFAGADPGFPVGGIADHLGGGRQHTILSNFPKNCMKSRKFWAVGRARARGAPLNPPLVCLGGVCLGVVHPQTERQTPPPAPLSHGQNDRQCKKYYLSVTTVADGKYSEIKILLLGFNAPPPKKTSDPTMQGPPSTRSY